MTDDERREIMLVICVSSLSVYLYFLIKKYLKLNSPRVVKHNVHRDCAAVGRVVKEITS